MQVAPELLQLLHAGDLDTMLQAEVWQLPRGERMAAFGAQLATAYYAVAVEQEYLLDAPAYFHTYREAVRTAEDLLGPSDPLTLRFRKSLTRAARHERHLRVIAHTSPAATADNPELAHSLTRADQASPLALADALVPQQTASLAINVPLHVTPAGSPVPGPWVTAAGSPIPGATPIPSAKAVRQLPPLPQAPTASAPAGPDGAVRHGLLRSLSNGPRSVT